MKKIINLPLWAIDQIFFGTWKILRQREAVSRFVKDNKIVGLRVVSSKPFTEFDSITGERQQVVRYVAECSPDKSYWVV